MEKQKSKYTIEQLDSVNFNPAKNYTWSYDTEFTLTGKEFEMLFNQLLNFVNEPFGVQSSMKMLAIYHLMETKFKSFILEGKIKELTKEDMAKALDTVEFEEVINKPSVKETDLETEA